MPTILRNCHLADPESWIQLSFLETFSPFLLPPSLRSQDTGPVQSVSFRTDGQPLMVTSSRSGHVAVWDLEKRKLASVMRGAHDAAVAGMACLQVRRQEEERTKKSGIHKMKSKHYVNFKKKIKQSYGIYGLIHRRSDIKGSDHLDQGFRLIWLPISHPQKVSWSTST